jgi:TPP-dependent pyruvate/acetoin dehydrogenase alpha subunit
LVHAQDWLLAHGADAAQVHEVLSKSQQEVQAAVEEALAAPWPSMDTAYSDVQDIGGPLWHS